MQKGTSQNSAQALAAAVVAGLAAAGYMSFLRRVLGQSASRPSSRRPVSEVDMLTALLADASSNRDRKGAAAAETNRQVDETVDAVIALLAECEGAEEDAKAAEAIVAKLTKARDEALAKRDRVRGSIKRTLDRKPGGSKAANSGKKSKA